MISRFTGLAVLWLAVAPAGAQQLDFVTGLTEYRDIRGMLPDYLLQKASGLLAERRQTIARFSTPADIAARKAYLRQRFLEALGGLPERTPLNPRVVGVLDRGDYRIEKVVFESQPRFYVTANLYVPQRGQPPYPGILYPLGHERGGKSYEVWQQMLGSLAKKGYVALTWDPVGQGERVQLWDEDFASRRLGGSTTEHTMIGIECLLTGDNLARYTIWDGMRALDYLMSRKEVDRSRIACTGNSGGGTHTAYLSALDDRIQVAAPSCYLTSWGRLLTSIGPQDAEQNLPPWLMDHLDHPDFVIAFAPKPYLMLSAIRDFFSISGARETFAEAKHVYELAGAGEKMSMFAADDTHGYSKPRRLAAYKWFSRWLKGKEEDEPEPEVQLATAEELWCTPTGQVVTSLGGETVYSLNEKRAGRLRGQRPPLSREAIRRVIAYAPQQGEVPAWPYGVISHPGYRIEKWVYESEPGILVPSLLYVPEGEGRKPAVIYLNGRGKSADAEDMARLAKAGNVVLVIDARGWGETGPARTRRGSEWTGYFGDFDSAMTALLVGKPLVGMRAEDVTRGIDFLRTRSQVDPEKIYGIGRDAGAVPLLHAAALDERIKRVALDGMLESYDSVVRSKAHHLVFENIARGVLRVYDLPGLAAFLAPRPVWIVDAVDPLGRPVTLEETRKLYGEPSERLHLQRRGAGEALSEIYLKMLM